MPSVPGRRGVLVLIGHLSVATRIPLKGHATAALSDHDKKMAIPYLLARSMPDSYSAPARRVDPAGRQQIVRRVAEARGWPEPKAARLVDSLLRLLHTVGPE